MKYCIYILLFISIYACSKNNDIVNSSTPIEEPDFISAVDISGYPEIRLSDPIFYNLENSQVNFLDILKENGVNTIRLRLWVNPQTPHSGFQEVKEFSRELKLSGFKIWISLHYSDTWADPGNQETPAQWQGIEFSALKDSVQNYTQRVVEQINPELIQIGNELNAGFMHPAGNLTVNPEQFKELMVSAIGTVRNSSWTCKIIIHYAGLDNSSWFFEQLNDLDYDIIGLSYYPIWHGKDLDNLKNKLQELSQTNQKDIVVAETAYPFTLGWNDLTHNIIGLEEHLILPQFPATPKGQQEFIKSIKDILLKKISNGLGFCYWGADLIAWKGDQSTDASPWENQALFDFENKALPVLEEFRIE